MPTAPHFRWKETYVCVNDVAGDPPAIGQERFGKAVMPVTVDYVVVDGGVLFEALRDRHARPRPRVEQRTFTTSSAGGSYRAALRVLLVGEHRYLDTGWQSPDAA